MPTILPMSKSDSTRLSVDSWYLRVFGVGVMVQSGCSSMSAAVLCFSGVPCGLGVFPPPFLKPLSFGTIAVFVTLLRAIEAAPLTPPVFVRFAAVSWADSIFIALSSQHPSTCPVGTFDQVVVTDQQGLMGTTRSLRHAKHVSFC
uniref:Uncharacterized protein n=1 Tax=Moniliophthora roreri TaxID=221103 RepID=A0A0W0EYD1_MONRR